VNQKLDDIRAEIVARLGAAQDDVEAAEHAYKVAQAELEAHDRAVAAIAEHTEPAPEPQRQRQQVQRMVLDELRAAGATGRTIGELCVATDIDPMSIGRVLKRLVAASNVTQEGERYRLAPDPHVGSGGGNTPASSTSFVVAGGAGQAAAE
jgi:hypothetical protein